MSTEPAAENFFSLKLRPWGMLNVLMTMACIGTLLGYLGFVWWPFENCGCFKVQCFWFLLIGAGVYAKFKRRNSALVLAAFALANATSFVPLYFGRDIPKLAAPEFRVMLANVHTGNTQHQRVLDAVRAEKPDAVVFLEIDSRWAAKLQELKDEYPHSRVDPRPDNFGIAFFSRVKPEQIRLEYIGAAGVPTVRAQYVVNGKPLTLIGTHPVPPVTGEYVHFRNEQMTEMAEMISRMTGAVVLAGDLNMTSDSPVFRALCSNANLRDSRQGFGVQGSWPLGLPTKIAIDHCLVSPHVKIHNRRLGPDVNSDHYPVIVDLSIE
ncbi:MAG TPA: endonuclease/exonuclease/phosphatase family protein [Planctomycetota bacterium]|nr:endonuclease/exonuclease/phosphatase family protein [Planctomycetota bacterium]